MAIKAVKPLLFSNCEKLNLLIPNPYWTMLQKLGNVVCIDALLFSRYKPFFHTAQQSINQIKISDKILKKTQRVSIFSKTRLQFVILRL